VGGQVQGKNGRKAKKKRKSTVVSSKEKRTVMNPILCRMKKRSPSIGQNGQLVHWWLLVHSGRKRWHRNPHLVQNPLFGHIGDDEISKNRKNKYTGLQRGMKLSLTANLVLNRVCLVLAFAERLRPITAAALCTVVINVLAPRAFNPESQYFIP
jgi:hypothetical protein